MKLSAIVLARVLGFVESIDLSPHGEVFYPKLLAGISEKFGFTKFPQKIEDFDETKGVEFISGMWGDVVVEKLSIYRHGLQLDTRASTKESQRVLLEWLSSAASAFGLKYDSKMVQRWRYLSNLTFNSDCPFLLRGSSPVEKLNERIHRAVSGLSGDYTSWEPIVLTFHSEQVPRKPVGAPFTIHRRAETPFSENKYYSEAPLPTETHISLLEAFEADVLQSYAVK